MGLRLALLIAMLLLAALPAGAQRSLRRLAMPGTFWYSTGYEGESIVLNPNGTYRIGAWSCTYSYFSLGYYFIRNGQLVLEASKEPVQNPEPFIIIAKKKIPDTLIRIKVIDENNEVLEGAYIKAQKGGTKFAAIADTNGMAQFQSNSIDSMEITFVGYEKCKFMPDSGFNYFEFKLFFEFSKQVVSKKQRYLILNRDQFAHINKGHKEIFSNKTWREKMKKRWQKKNS